MNSVWQRQVAAYHPTVGWWWIPNLKAIVSREEGPPFLMRTNSVGMRSSREYPLARPNKRKRITLLGDSYTAGNGVNNGERFSDFLERSYPNIDVMNFGLAGSGTDQQLLVYESIAKPFEADAFIFAPYTANIVRNRLGFFPILGQRNVHYRAKPYFTLDGEQLVLHNQPVPVAHILEAEALKREAERPEFGRTSPARGSWLATRLMPLWMSRTALGARISLAFTQAFDGYTSEDSEDWRLMRAILERFIRQIDGTKPILIIPLPSHYHFLRNLAPTYLARFASLHNPKANCFVLDVLPYFEPLSYSDRKKCVYGVNNTHYSAFGHKIVADAISNFLTDHFPGMAEEEE